MCNFNRNRSEEDEIFSIMNWNRTEFYGIWSDFIWLQFNILFSEKSQKSTFALKEDSCLHSLWFGCDGHFWTLSVILCSDQAGFYLVSWENYLIWWLFDRLSSGDEMWFETCFDCCCCWRSLRLLSVLRCWCSYWDFSWYFRSCLLLLSILW